MGEAIASAGEAPGPEAGRWPVVSPVCAILLKDSPMGLAESFLCAEGCGLPVLSTPNKSLDVFLRAQAIPELW